MRLNAYAIDKPGFDQMIAWGEHLGGGVIPASLRALVETRVSQINGCAFCLAMHADEGRRAGVPQAKLDTVAAWRDDSSFTEQEGASLELAEMMTRIGDGGRVSDEVWERASRCFDDKELTTLIQVIAAINVFNRINIATERTAQDYQRYAASQR
jgi:AhpD family alkylhydroperoxidase